MSYNEVVPMEIYVNDYREKVRDFDLDENLMGKYWCKYVVYVRINVRLNDWIEDENRLMREDLAKVLDEFHPMMINKILFDEEKIR